MKIVAVDLQAMAPLPGVVQIQGDITKVCRLKTTGIDIGVKCGYKLASIINFNKLSFLKGN